jgi:hypothetical protein
MRGICDGFRHLRWMTGDLTMPARARRLTAWIAILAIALQATLVGFSAWAPVAAATIDPATVICHSVPLGADNSQQAPASHDDCCSQCILCGSVLATDLPAISTPYTPPRLTPAKFSSFSATGPFAPGAAGPHFPRGPPAFA